MSRKWTPYLLAGLLLCLVGALYLAGNGRMALWDRDEGWYAEIARGMLHSDPSEWIVPMFQGRPFSGKPPLTFWCQAATMGFLGESAFAARLPSVLATLLTILIVGVALERIIGARRALWTMLILSTSLVIILAAKMCLTDAVLLLWITIAQLCLYAVYRGSRRWAVILALWISVALSILTKGPVVIGMMGATIAALWMLDLGRQWHSPRAWLGAARWWRGLRPLAGLLIVTVIVVPWAWLLWVRSPDYFNESIIHHMFKPIAREALAGHGGLPGYYLLLIWPMLLPWSLLLPLAIIKGWNNRRLPPIRFALSAVVGPWIVLELVKQKLPFYMLPIMPALAFLLADTVVRCLRRQYHAFHRPVVVWGAAGWAMALAALSLAPWILLLPQWGFHDLPVNTMLFITALGLVYAAGTFDLFRRQRPRAALLAMGMGMMLLTGAVAAVLLPRLPFLRVPELVGQYLAQSPGNQRIVLAAYNPPSLVFYTRGAARSCSSLQDLSRLPPEDRPVWVITSAQQWQADPQAALWLEKVREFHAFDYGGSGQIVQVYLARNRNFTDTAQILPRVLRK